METDLEGSAASAASHAGDEAWGFHPPGLEARCEEGPRRRSVFFGISNFEPTPTGLVGQGGVRLSHIRPKRPTSCARSHHPPRRVPRRAEPVVTIRSVRQRLGRKHQRSDEETH